MNKRERARERERGVSARLSRDNNNTAYKTIRYYTSYFPTLKRDTNLIYIRALGVAARPLTAPIKRGVLVGHFWGGDAGGRWTLRARYWLIFGLLPNKCRISWTGTRQCLLHINGLVSVCLQSDMLASCCCHAGKTYVNIQCGFAIF